MSTYDFDFKALDKGTLRQQAALDVARIALSIGVAARGGVSPAGPFRTGGYAAQSHHANAIGEYLDDVYRRKAAVVVGTTDTASALLPVQLADVFVQHQSVFGVVDRIGAVPVPFKTPVPVATLADIPAYRHVEGQMKPASADLLDTEMVAPGSTVGLVVITDALARSGRAEAIVLDRLSRAVARATDAALVSDAVTAAGAYVASSSGPEADLAAVLALYLAAGGAAESAVLLMSSANAIGLRVAAPELGRDLTPAGGTLGGVRVVASSAVGASVVAVDAAMLLLASGDVAVSAASHADVAMDDGGGTGAQSVSLWQRNLVGLRVERFVNWHIAGATAVVTDADYLPLTT